MTPRLTALIAHYHGIKTRAEAAGWDAIADAAQDAIAALTQKETTR